MSDDGARIFSGMPAATHPLDTAEGLRALAKLVEAGHVAVRTYHLRIEYYAKTKTEEGYELRQGELFSPNGRG